MKTLYVYCNGGLIRIAKCFENEAKVILDECSRMISEESEEHISLMYSFL